MFKPLFKVALMTAITAAGIAPAMAKDGDAEVVELRQYKLTKGAGDAFVALFEDQFVESQEALGMRLVGQFRDQADPDRFTWIRAFTDMPARETGLNAFYFGPVWQANRDAANPMLVDNDNVLLLRPAAPDLAFAPAAPRRAAGEPGGAVWVIIEYLWKTPDEGFAAFFADRMKPALTAAGVDVAGAYVPLAEPNNFPRLPVRDDRKLLVWFVRGDSHAGIEAALASARQSPRWQAEIEAPLRDAEERAPQILRLDPTPRSALR
jgi:hypothetical protein